MEPLLITLRIPAERRLWTTMARVVGFRPAKRQAEAAPPERTTHPLGRPPANSNLGTPSLEAAAKRLEPVVEFHRPVGRPPEPGTSAQLDSAASESLESLAAVTGDSVAPEITLPEAFIISGQVRSVTGEPIANAFVSSLPAAASGPVRTEADGTYALEVEDPGQYIIAAQFSGFRMVSHPVKVVDTDCSEQDLTLRPIRSVGPFQPVAASA